jgi:uncharacterized protein
MTRRWRRLVIAGFALLVLVGPMAVEFYTDWLWFGETGYQRVFLRVLTARAALGAIATVLAFAVLLLNIRVPLGRFSPRQLVFTTPEGPIAFSIDPRLARTAAGVVAALSAVMLGLYASSQWLNWLQFLHGQPFGAVDPVLARDAGFYVFRLPFLRALYGFLLALVVLSGVGAAAAYVLTGAVSVNLGHAFRIGDLAKRHLAALIAALLAVLAFGAYLDVPRILTTPAGVLHGAANVDVALRIPALRVLTVVAALGAILALYQLITKAWWPIITAAALYISVAAGAAMAASLMQRFAVAPNELARETPFIEHNIAATRKAFALDKVKERDLSGDALLTRADIEANDATLGNVRLSDPQPLLQTFGQIQEIRTYYDFVSVHNDRYPIDGEYRQIMLSARELNSESLPNRNWINERLTFTHGYGVTLGPVNQVTPEGLPTLFIKDLPPTFDRSIFGQLADGSLSSSV